MKLIIDTNILYSYFWRNTITKRLIIQEDFELYAPEFALEEIKKYKADIIKKTKITEDEFKVSKFDLAISIKFIPIEDYKKYLKQALEISPDPNDIDFLALAMKLNLPLWSNDLKLKKQNKVQILNTKEILTLLDKQ